MARKNSLASFTCASLSVLLLAGITAPMLPISTVTESAIAQTPTKKKKVVVVDFDFASTSDSSYWYGYRGGAAKGISDILVNKLVNDGSFTVTSRSALENYLRDNKISGNIDEAMAVKIGKALGVDAVIVGTVTRFNVEKRRSGGSFMGFGGGSEKTKGVVQLTTRVIDPQTQSIVAAVEGLGEADSSGASASIGGIVSGGSSASGSDEVLSKAADDAIVKVVDQLKKRI